MSPVRFWSVTALLFVLAMGYLFYTAPVPLTAEESAKKTYSTREAMAMLALENDVTRTLYTKAIVGAGKARGLAFSEQWADPEVVAGPLPALFLRGVAEELHASEVPLGLYLGSDFPIESSNQFQGKQADAFSRMRESLEPQFLFDDLTNETVGMYPDFASAPACVSCHNEHERTTKSDWKLGDLMGATTWSYPGDSITTDELVAMLKMYRTGVANVWGRYLAEIQSLDPAFRPEIGSQWPSHGNFVPDAATFQDSVARLASVQLMNYMLHQHD